jgi:shikimate kinase
MNITLIGMSGAGKSHVGKDLAKRLPLELFDVDDEMEVLHGKPLQDILDEIGEEAFMKEEEAMVLTLSPLRNCVISPGGSIIYSEAAMKHLKEISTILFLDVPCAVIEARIDSAKRGIVGLKHKTFSELYEERRPLYLAYADHIVTPDMTREEVVAIVLKT